MAPIRPAARSMLHWETVLKQSRLYRPQKRCFADMVQTSSSHEPKESVAASLLQITPDPSSKQKSSSLTIPLRSSRQYPRELDNNWNLDVSTYTLAERAIADRHHRPPTHTLTPIQVHAPLPSARDICKEPLKAIDDAQIALLDPTGARTRLFSRTNPEAAHVGDVLLVRQKTGDPFAGVCINIRRRGADTGILLRGQLTRVGVEMWFKIYSPNVQSIEVVQRYEQWKKSGKSQRPRKRPRRARLYYMRTGKHDRGSVENVVRLYQRERAALGRAGPAGNGGGSAAGRGKSGKNKR